MPVAYLDLPTGLASDTKKKLVKEVADSIHHAYMIPDTICSTNLNSGLTHALSVAVSCSSGRGRKQI
jgi:hypothetical protein